MKEAWAWAWDQDQSFGFAKVVSRQILLNRVNTCAPILGNICCGSIYHEGAKQRQKERDRE